MEIITRTIFLYRLWQVYAMIILISYVIRQGIKIATAENDKVVVKEFLKGIVILPIITFIAIQ